MEKKNSKNESWDEEKIWEQIDELNVIERLHLSNSNTRVKYSENTDCWLLDMAKAAMLTKVVQKTKLYFGQVMGQQADRWRMCPSLDVSLAAWRPNWIMEDNVPHWLGNIDHEASSLFAKIILKT